MIKSKGKGFVVMLCMMVIFALLIVGCTPKTVETPSPNTGEQKEEPQIVLPKRVFAVGSASAGSLYITYTAAWADLLMKNIDGMNVTVEPGGSSQNMKMIHSGDMDFGITATLQSYPGFHGTGWANGVKYDKVNSLFPGYSYEGVFLTLESKRDINSIQDLNGKTIGLGYAGGGSDFTGRELLEFFDVKPKEFVNASWTDIGGMMKDGLVDAIYYLAGHPAGFIQELELQHNLKFFTLTDAEFARFKEAKPIYNVGIVPNGTYKSMTDYKALQGWNFIIISPSFSEDFVYMLTKTTWENIAMIQGAHRSFVQTQLENVKYMNLPLHPGAKKYYQEKGVELPILPPPPKN